MEFYTTAELGPSRFMTPEGYLLCRDVPIARTGQQKYMAQELGGAVTPDAAGMITIQRDPEEVFRAETIASFNGKPIVMDYHQMTDAKTWRGRSVGVVLNPRRAEDFLVADLLFCEATAIQRVADKKIEEVSCGYTADYEETAPGFGRQVSILGNHLAIVERGRCGPACAIGDKDPMATKNPTKKNSWFDRLRGRHAAGDTEGLEGVIAEMEEAGETGGGAPSIIINVPGAAAPAAEEKKTTDEGNTEPTLADVIAKIDSIGERVAKLEAGGTKTGDEETEEEKAKREAEEKARAETGDSAALLTTFNDTISGAEILSPGIKLPTFDAKASPKVTLDSMCALRRNALAAHLGAGAGVSWGDSLGVKAAHVEAMSCDTINGLFGVAVRDRKATARGAPGAFGSLSLPTGDQLKTYKPKTPAERNAAARKKWGFDN